MFQEFDKQLERLRQKSLSDKELKAVKEIEKIKALIVGTRGKSEDKQKVLSMIEELLKKANTAAEFQKLYTEGVPSLELIVRDLKKSKSKRVADRTVEFGKAIEEIFKNK